jgi:hypothetical protein
MAGQGPIRCTAGPIRTLELFFLGAVIHSTHEDMREVGMF